MPDEALTAYFSFLSPINHVLLLPPLLATRTCTVFSFLCVNKHYKKEPVEIKSHREKDLSPSSHCLYEFTLDTLL
jgi:hypothetical protein